MSINLRIWAVASGLAIAAVLAGGWFIGVQPQLEAAAASTVSASSVDAQNQATRIRLANLTKAAANMDAMQQQNAVLLKAVPSILKPNTFIRRVNELAALDGVSVVSITPGDAVPYSVPASIAGAASPTGIPAPKVAKTDPAINPANFTVVPVTVVVSGEPDAVLQFAHDVQNDERTFSINGFQSTKNDSSSTVSTALSGYIYVLKR